MGVRSKKTQKSKKLRRSFRNSSHGSTSCPQTEREIILRALCADGKFLADTLSFFNDEAKTDEQKKKLFDITWAKIREMLSRHIDLNFYLSQDGNEENNQTWREELSAFLLQLELDYRKVVGKMKEIAINESRRSIDEARKFLARKY